MLEFILLTVSITLGIMLSSVVMLLVMLQPKVMLWYAKKVTDLTNKMFETMNEELEEKDLKEKSEDL